MFVAMLMMTRLAGKRFLSEKTAFDAVLGFMIASMLARACNGNSPYWPTMAGGFVLVGIHRFIGKASCRWHGFGNVVKGHSGIVIQDGRVFREILRAHDLSEHDLMEDLHLNGNVASPEEVKLAYFERNGQISVIKKEG